MSALTVNIDHTLGLDEARSRLHVVQEKLTQRFEAQCHWNGNRLVITHQSLNGHIDVTANALNIQATLSFPLSLMKGKLEQELKRLVSDTFS